MEAREINYYDEFGLISDMLRIILYFCFRSFPYDQVDEGNQKLAKKLGCWARGTIKLMLISP